MIVRRDMLLSGASLAVLTWAGPAAAKKFGFKEAALAMTAMALGMAAFVAALKDANARNAARLSDAQVQGAAEILKLYASVSELALVQRTITLAEMEKYGDGPLPSEWQYIKARIGKTVDAIDQVNALFDQQINAFILSDMYPAFKGNFTERAALLRRVQALPAPKSRKEVGYFRDLTGEYRKLLDQVDALRGELQFMLRVTGAPGGMVGAPGSRPAPPS